MPADVSLQRAWRRRLKEDGFDDIELPDGSLRGPQKPPGRWRSFDAASPLEREATSEYFIRATTFCATYVFSRLPPKVRSVWRLHAKGQSNSEVAKTLGFSLKTVRNSLRSARARAGLPEVTSSIGHGR
jgi:DNA-directed RNA polymerase specialized sigma24 family protein